MTIEREELLKNFLIGQGAHYQEQQLTSFKGIQKPVDRLTPALSILDHKAVIEAEGVDTFKFLQGQLSCDTSKLAAGQHQPGTVCTPKGRMYSQFQLLKRSDNSALLAMHSGLTATTVANLGKYAVFFKTELKQREDLYCLGFSGQGIEPALTELFGQLPDSNNSVAIDDSGWLIQISEQRYEAWLTLESLQKRWPEFMQHFTPVSQQHWRLQDIEAVTPVLSPETAETYIPQHFNQPSLGSVSFRKGCYTGQEIVARMQNLGQLKSRCYHLTANEALQLNVRDKLFNDAGKGIGEVVDSVIDGDRTELLAVIRVDAAECNLARTETGQHLECHPLPYEIDPKAELQQ